MGLFRDLAKTGAARAVAGTAIAFYIRLVFLTGRWQIIGEEHPAAFWNSGAPFVGCFWHGRLLMMAQAWRTRAQTMTMVISRHRDGEIIARAMRHFGVGAVHGSTAKAGTTDKGGSDAVRQMIKIVKAGNSVGITPDGPRGPRMRIAAGIIQIARMTGKPIVPATFSARRRKVMGSWDRFIVALPFSSGVILWGKPIQVPRDLDADGIEAKRREVEDALNALTAEADRLCGHAPIEPGPPLDAQP
ncbi:MAG: lysophospholipid acyltransferase family protein [Alphaproteobacteria bacterium]|jgi:lysophospholipid acyltransferase (LPLAT)-like uncharacterized protein|nr:lysophospholipid acyltransferase family protein [Alphaproteobacteria bacterium]